MYKVYRDGGGPIEGRIETAVGHFYTAYGALPSAILVNATELDAAREAVEALLLNVEVTSTGGCLVPEVWLAMANVGDDQPQPEVARGEVTPAKAREILTEVEQLTLFEEEAT